MTKYFSNDVSEGHIKCNFYIYLSIYIKLINYLKASKFYKFTLRGFYNLATTESLYTFII